MPENMTAIEAQAHLHHQYLLGLQLAVATHEGRAVIEEWVFRLFRQQHKDKFLSSFSKLGLDGEPHAVACAKYHVLANGVGGVRVEYMEENARKAWVRFRYPRWMFDGPVLCGMPVEASRGFLKGWYAENGVSLNNPRLGFVCVSEDMTGQFGLCGYFKEYDHDLSEEERLQFAPDELPPPFDPAKQPAPPATEWNAERLTKAARNYSMEYCRNGIRELVAVIGLERTLEVAQRAARLTGLQQYSGLAERVGAVDGDIGDAAFFLSQMFVGMGDDVTLEISGDRDRATLRQSAPRFARGIDGTDRDTLLACWNEIWRGTVNAHSLFMKMEVMAEGDGQVWSLSPLR